MELYAWSKLFQVKSRKLLDLQGNKGNFKYVFILCIIQYCFIITYYYNLMFNLKSNFNLTGGIVFKCSSFFLSGNKKNWIKLYNK